MQSVFFWRFNEWGRAAWELQKAFKDSGRGHDWRYTCFYDEDSDWGLAADMKAAANSMNGMMYSVRSLVM